MTNATGPAELRRIADALDEQSAVFSSAGWIVITNTTDVRQQAAAWDADISARDHAVDLAGINAEAANELERRAERAEAALDRATNDLMLSEESFVTMRAKRDEVLSELRTTRAALEQARALLMEWRKFGSHSNFSAGAEWFIPFCDRVDQFLKRKD